MSGFIPFGAGALSNIDTTYEQFGGSGGDYTYLASIGSTNTKAAWTEIGTATADLAGIYVSLSISTSDAARFNFDIGTGAAASEVVLIPDVHVTPSAFNMGPLVLYFPLNIAAGTRIAARQQSSVASATFGMVITGEVRTGNHPPLYNSCEKISSAPTNTFASGTTITAVTSAGTGWTQINASTSRTYGAIMALIGIQTSGTAPTTTQRVHFKLATGAAASEVMIGRSVTSIGNAAPSVVKCHPILIHKSVASGTRISAEILAGTAGAQDKFSPYVLGFY